MNPPPSHHPDGPSSRNGYEPDTRGAAGISRHRDIEPTPPAGLADNHGWAHELEGPREDSWESGAGSEVLTEGVTHLLDLVAAVDHLGRGLRHHFTVWDALEEALRSWAHEQPTNNGTPEAQEPPWNEPDPLRTTLEQLLDSDPDQPLAVVFQQAVRRWVRTMAYHFNAGYCWPHPKPRRTFPEPLTG